MNNRNSCCLTGDIYNEGTTTRPSGQHIAF